MSQKSFFAFVALLGLISAGCRTPYGGGCSGGSCGAGAPAGGSYAPTPQTYAPTNQQAMPPAFQGGGSGSRIMGGGSGSR
ncbi:MAG: hypothetical protein GXP24_02575 [Planctomycetes bacterium]|nr:hypothetical protein [Planctomycetota bacterium]